MRKTILLFTVVLLAVGGIVAWLVSAGTEIKTPELIMVVGVIILLSFAIILGIRRFRSVRKSQPAEDELSKGIMIKAASSSYYFSLYSWLALMYFSDNTQMEMSSFIGLGILIMAVEFVLSWVYHNYFSKSQ